MSCVFLVDNFLSRVSSSFVETIGQPYPLRPHSSWAATRPWLRSHRWSSQAHALQPQPCWLTGAWQDHPVFQEGNAFPCYHTQDPVPTPEAAGPCTWIKVINQPQRFGRLHVGAARPGSHLNASQEGAHEEAALEHGVVRAINNVLLCRVIRLGDLDPIVAGFATLGFLNCSGVIDGTYIPFMPQNTLPPSISTARNIFRWSCRALCRPPRTVQFSDIFVGWSERAHDCRVFRNSSLYQKLETGTFFPEHNARARDVEMPLCIMGDAAYLLML